MRTDLTPAAMEQLTEKGLLLFIATVLVEIRDQGKEDVSKRVNRIRSSRLPH